MKLIYCTECHDVFALADTERRCTCSKSGGRYTTARSVEVFGSCAVLGIGNQSLVNAVEWHNEEAPNGFPFTAFVIPDGCEWVKRVDIPDDDGLIEFRPNSTVAVTTHVHYAGDLKPVAEYEVTPCAKCGMYAYWHHSAIEQGHEYEPETDYKKASDMVRWLFNNWVKITDTLEEALNILSVEMRH
jgi:hypothetical protein